MDSPSKRSMSEKYFLLRFKHLHMLVLSVPVCVILSFLGPQFREYQRIQLIEKRHGESYYANVLSDHARLNRGKLRPNFTISRFCEGHHRWNQVEAFADGRCIVSVGLDHDWEGNLERRTFEQVVKTIQLLPPPGNKNLSPTDDQIIITETASSREPMTRIFRIDRLPPEVNEILALLPFRI